MQTVLNWHKSSETHAKIYAKIIRHDNVIAEDALIGYNTVQQRKRIDMFIIGRMRITPSRLLVGCCIVLES